MAAVSIAARWLLFQLQLDGCCFNCSWMAAVLTAAGWLLFQLRLAGMQQQYL